MSIRFEIKGKQYHYLPEKKDQTFHIDFQKSTKVGDQIIFDKVLSRDEEFGQPYLKNIKLVGEIIKHGLNKKITVMKYKPKKRYKKKLGHRQQYTKIKIISVKETV
jgi:large subunit ribosomal protein L21